MPPDVPPTVRRRWRFYATATGRKPVLEFLRGLLPEHAADAAQIAEEMEHVRRVGTRAARKLSGDIYEVRVDGDHVIYRVLFSVEGGRGRILLAIEAFSKKTQKTPPQLIDVAEKRLVDWRRRG
jgi:phage-related protein